MEELSERQRYWLNHLKACKTQGVSLRAYADAEGLGLASLYAWNRKLRQYLDDDRPASDRVVSPQFIPIELDRTSLFNANCRIELANGVVLHWPLTAAPGALRQLLPILATARP